jgi:hypothetical protein
MLAAAPDIVVNIAVVAAVTVAVVIIPIAVVHWRLCCTALSSFCCVGWLLPVACLCCWHLCCASLFRLIDVFTAHCYGGTADDNAVAFAANAATPAVAVAITTSSTVTVVVAAATIIAAAAAATTAAIISSTASLA